MGTLHCMKPVGRDIVNVWKHFVKQIKSIFKLKISEVLLLCIWLVKMAIIKVVGSSLWLTVIQTFKIM